MNADNDQSLLQLVGNDNRGRVFRGDDRIFRAVSNEYRDVAISVFEKYQRFGLKAHGIVETELLASGPYLFAHRRHLTTYPFEWAGEMLRDAALYTLDLIDTLGASDLTLKDALPSNIVFDGIEPRFVDFLSIVETGRLAEEDWLVSMPRISKDPRSVVLLNMFAPFFLMPLLAMSTGNAPLGRDLLRNKACNQGHGIPTPWDVYKSRSFLWQPRLLIYTACLIRAATQNYEASIAGYRNLVKRLTLSKSGSYSKYYEDKGEDFSIDRPETWFAKQKGVAGFLGTVQPASVIDIGSNTGWFSRLAERQGAKVISVDVDEPSINRLYLQAKQDKLAITPLKMAFGDFGRAVPDAHGNVFFDRPESRLGCECVLMLALVHHLTLGEGRSFDEVFSQVSALCTKAAVVEFVEFEDELVSGNPGFFKHIQDWQPSDYSLEAALSSARRHFSEISVAESHPTTRSLIFLRK